MNNSKQGYIDEVCEALGFSQHELSIKNRQQEVALARHLAIAFLLNYPTPKFSRTEATKAFSRKRVTSYHSVKVVNNIITTKTPLWAFHRIDFFISSFVNKFRSVNITEEKYEFT